MQEGSYPVVGTIVGAILGALGLGYRIQSSRTESRRKEAKELVSKIISCAQGIETLAIQYQMIDGTDLTCAAKGEEIRKQFKCLGLMVSEFRQISGDKALGSALVRFRQKASGNLDERFRKAAARNDKLLTEIEDSCRVFCDTAQTIFHSRFK